MWVTCYDIVTISYHLFVTIVYIVVINVDMPTAAISYFATSQLMPAWSIAEWRAHIGSSWCALGRPFKTRSPFRNGARMEQREFTLNQVVMLMFFKLVMMLVGLSCALLRVGHYQPLLSEYLEKSC